MHFVYTVRFVILHRFKYKLSISYANAVGTSAPTELLLYRLPANCRQWRHSVLQLNYVHLSH